MLASQYIPGVLMVLPSIAHHYYQDCCLSLCQNAGSSIPFPGPALMKLTAESLLVIYPQLPT